MKKNYFLGAMLIILSSQLVKAQSATEVIVNDTRAVNEVPSDFRNKVKFDFKLNTTIGVPTSYGYTGLMTIAPWQDASGGKNHQLGFNDGGIYYRTGAHDSPNWDAWRKLLIQDRNGNVEVGSSNKFGMALLDKFGFNGVEQPHYGFQWLMDPDFSDGNAFWLSAFGGIKFFTLGSPRLTIKSNGNVGIGTTTPSYYFHGGNNKVLEINNPNTSINSQSQIVLGTGSVLANSFAGTITWVSSNSINNKGLAYIGAVTTSEAITNASGRLVFATADNYTPLERMTIDATGNVGIGTTNPTSKLAVNGNIRAREIKVENANWPDYVFARAYKLPSLQETEQHIKEKGHLPGIPSAEEVKNNGVDLGEMNAKLLQKIEELTLHLIEMKKESENQRKEIEKLKGQIKKQ